jgi:epsilon-lactone hydrolase
MSSEQLRQMADLFASIKERLSKPNIDLAMSRDILENLHLAASEPEAVTYAEVDADGVPALWCIPEGCDMDRVLLHSHSGGAVVTSMHTDRKAIGHIAKVVGVRALILDFRRAPEHKFPAQINDVEKAYRWLLDQGLQPQNIASIGHSIGGNLAVSLAAMLRDKGAPLPAALLSVSPWYDMEMKNETLETNDKTDALLTRQVLEFFRESWIGGTGLARNDPRVNMLYADLSGLPPIMVYYGDYEMLAGEAIEFAKRAKDAGVDVTLRSLPEGQHNFILGAGRVPEVDQAIAELGKWLRSKFGLASTPIEDARRIASCHQGRRNALGDANHYT